MRRSLLSAVLMTLVLVGSVVGTGYAAAGGFNASQFCKANGDFGVDHDTCVLFFNNGKGNGAVAICKVYQDFGILDAFGFKNLGDCVSFIKSL